MHLEEEWDYDAWSEGHSTAMHEREWKNVSNPYEPGTAEYRSWADGYRCGVIDRENCRD